MAKKRKFDNDGLFVIPAEAVDALPVSAHADTLSTDGRRVKRDTHHWHGHAPSTVASTVPSSVFNDNPFFEKLDWDEYLKDDPGDPELDEERPDVTRAHTTNGHRDTSSKNDAWLEEWTEHRQQFLHELLRHDGLCNANIRECPTCPKSNRGKWNGTFFERAPLSDLGLVIQLGHNPGESCRAPMCGPRSFMVMHTNGLHSVNMQFCECARASSAGSRAQQLLRYKLFPASVRDPTTCCTFAMMRHFHTTTLQSKSTMYDYYMTLIKLTDNTGLSQTYDRIRPFSRVVRMWRHLKSLKRNGRGHELSGVRGTQAGDLAVLCPACPRPGYNLPDNWETVTDELRFIYTMFVAIDANFRLKRRAISSEKRDPALSSGLGYFVQNTKYLDFIRDRADQKDISTCTGFAAMMQANTKWSKGYATTGVAMCVCARHGFILPNAVGDLQKGERFCNIDYIFSSAYRLFASNTPKVVSYDIACQWETHLTARLKALPAHVKIEIPTGEVRYAIPKYHFAGHKKSSHNKYSLNYLRGVGRTDGEEIERNWSRHDATAGSTREMGPGSRHDTLEDHFGWANWQKYINLGKQISKKYATAVKDRAKYEALYQEFKRDLQDYHVEEWTNAIVAWESDTKLDDPYDIKPTGPTEAEIRMQLATEEDLEVSYDSQVTPHAVSALSMLVTLLELEDQQRQLKAITTHNMSDSQTFEVHEKRTALRSRLVYVRTIQAIYMPCVSDFAADHERNRARAVHNRTGSSRVSAVSDLPEDVPLFLPHSLSHEYLGNCAPGLANMEARLREGQLRSALDTLRVYLHIKARMLKFKAQNVRHQGANTRAREKLNKNDCKIAAAAAKYRAAWAAKKKLSGDGTWQNEWRVLNQADIRCLQDDNGIQPARERSEGRRVVSWIWLSADKDGNAEGMTDALRIEFLKARARAHRFQEEVQLLEEERRRILVSIEARALLWERRGAFAAQKECPITRQGAVAYAAEQSAMFRRMQEVFRSAWAFVASRVTVADPGHVLDNALYTILQDDSDNDDYNQARDVDSEDDN
ncbi:hypothetical protein BDY19DRAFT_998729 [Irpex rosettiformis]|uniref:Uncharacterized protein n=1 Tax=Irpex rosettiformis TaxID=378272 RepID=A0ACB8TMK8_9APHY|nr:hypothetical protein BDY19DRAFT_998729 [Irpex rosettiformis]